MEYITIPSLIFTLVISIIGGKLYKNKGYSFLGGFLWCFFLGLLGLLIVVFSKSKVDTTQKTASVNTAEDQTDDNNPIN